MLTKYKNSTNIKDTNLKKVSEGKIIFYWKSKQPYEKEMLKNDINYINSGDTEIMEPL